MNDLESKYNQWKEYGDKVSRIRNELLSIACDEDNQKLLHNKKNK